MTLTYSLPIKSSDIADHLQKGKNKTKTIKTLIIDLQTDKYCSIGDVIENVKLRKIAKDDAFMSIKKEVGDEDYNGAKVLVRIGKSKRTIDWDTFENAFEGKDITDELKNLAMDFNDALVKCSDKYIDEIRSKI